MEIKPVSNWRRERTTMRRIASLICTVVLAVTNEISILQG